MARLPFSAYSCYTRAFPSSSCLSLSVRRLSSSASSPVLVARRRQCLPDNSLPLRTIGRGIPRTAVLHDAAMIPDHFLAAQTYILQRLRRLMALVHPALAQPLSQKPTRHMPGNRSQAQRRNFSTQSLPLAQRIPRGSWDSHMHVVDPENYVLSPGAVYRPRSHTLDAALSFESSVGLDNIVLVQPSIYEHDNACLLDALRQLGPQRGRGVVSFDPATTPESQLREWHQLGVRGVRVNMQSNGGSVDSEHLTNVLRQYADAVRPLDWVVQVYVPMWLIEPLEAIIPTLNVRFCIDHMGSPSLKDAKSNDPYDLDGFKSLVRLLQGDQIFVKLSAPYRMSKTGGHVDLEPVAREIIRLKGESRVVFATDWPHTRFEGLDIRPWMEAVLDWCEGDDFLIERLFRGNAEALWDVTAA